MSTSHHAERPGLGRSTREVVAEEVDEGAAEEMATEAVAVEMAAEAVATATSAATAVAALDAAARRRSSGHCRIQVYQSRTAKATGRNPAGSRRSRLRSGHHRAHRPGRTRPSSRAVREAVVAMVVAVVATAATAAMARLSRTTESPRRHSTRRSSM